MLLEKIEYRVKQKTKKQNIMKKLLLVLLALPLLFSCGGSLDKEITDAMLDDNGYTGKGTFISGQDKYEGEWKNGKPHGQLIVSWDNGSKYNGEWKDGEQDGYGTYTWANGRKYVGEFKNNKRNGQGTATYPDGTVEKGLWENGEFLGE